MSVVRGSFPLVSLVCPVLVESPTVEHPDCEAGFTTGKHGGRLAEIWLAYRGTNAQTRNPGERTMTMTDQTMTVARPTLVWERACAVTDLEPSWGEAALIRMKQIALFLLSPTEIYAVDHRDPHTEANVMARGIVGSKGDRPTIASPLHKEVYDLGTGECFTNPTLILNTYETRVVGGYIEVAVETGLLEAA